MTVKTHRKRSLASAITYRATSTILLAMISYSVTGAWVESMTVTLAFALAATILFYFNDRAWERTDWGRVEGPIISGKSNGALTMPSSDRPFPSGLIPLKHELLEEAS